VSLDSALRDVARSAAFVQDTVPRLLLDADWVVRAVNPAYLRATDREAEDLISSFVFDAFPDNPDDPAADGVRNLAASLESALRSRATDDMFVQKYDVPSRDGGFTMKYWSPSNIPVVPDQGRRPAGVVHSVEDVTGFWTGLLGQEVLQTGAAVPPVLARALARNARAFERAEQELAELRLALESRVVIEQAKGVLMGRHGCAPDEAFAELRTIARSTQRRLHEVAFEVVRDALGRRSR
jgi:hypothetical protein